MKNQNNNLPDNNGPRREKMSYLKKYGPIALVAVLVIAAVFRIPQIRSKVIGG